MLNKLCIAAVVVLLLTSTVCKADLFEFDVNLADSGLSVTGTIIVNNDDFQGDGINAIISSNLTFNDGTGSGGPLATALPSNPSLSSGSNTLFLDIVGTDLYIVSKAKAGTPAETWRWSEGNNITPPNGEQRFQINSNQGGGSNSNFSFATTMSAGQSGWTELGSIPIDLGGAPAPGTTRAVFGTNGAAVPEPATYLFLAVLSVIVGTTTVLRRRVKLPTAASTN